jgi:hypothetical protein
LTDILIVVLAISIINFALFIYVCYLLIGHISDFKNDFSTVIDDAQQNKSLIISIYKKLGDAEGPLRVKKLKVGKNRIVAHSDSDLFKRETSKP